MGFMAVLAFFGLTEKTFVFAVIFALWNSGFMVDSQIRMAALRRAII